MKTQLFSSSLFIVRNVLLLSLFGTQFVLNSQTLSERGVTVISLAPPVVVPAKNITVSQALRFGEQVEPRPDLLATRTDIPIITAKQPIMFDHDLLRWEIGFDRGDGYHKLRVRVTNLSDTPQGVEMLYSPIASRDKMAEVSWRIAASKLIQPGQTFSDWQSVLIENNLTKLIFLMRRRDDPAKERALSAYGRNPEASYPIPPAVSLIADLTSDAPNIIATSNKPLSANMPLILPGMPKDKMSYLSGTYSIINNPDNHLHFLPFKLERRVDIPTQNKGLEFEMEGLSWKIKNFVECKPESERVNSSQHQIICNLKISATATNLTNDKQTVSLESAVPERGDGTIDDTWYTYFHFKDIYPGRSVTEEHNLLPIVFSDKTQREVPLRWIFRAQRYSSNRVVAVR